MRKKVILITKTVLYGKDANTIVDHSTSFPKYSKFNVTTVNLNRVGRFFCNNFNKYINSYHAVIIHYSVPTFVEDDYNRLKLLLSGFRGVKIIFIQDEYRYVKKVNNVLINLGIDIVYSCAGLKEARVIYKEAVDAIGVDVKDMLTGYIPESLISIKTKKIQNRDNDIVYRARKLPYYFGKNCQEKCFIGEEFLKRSSSCDIRVDISSKEEDRIYGKKWISFLSNSRASLGVESSICIIDYEGEIFDKAPLYIAENPDVTFEEIRRLFLKNAENIIDIKVISPRIFEAICCKTALVLFEGKYSNRIKEWDHYIPLKRDFSNFDQVISLIRDDDYIQKMVDRAYRDVVINGKNTYKYFISGVDEDIKDCLDSKKKQIKVIVGSGVLFNFYYKFNFILKIVYKVMLKIYNLQNKIFNIGNKFLSLHYRVITYVQKRL